MGRITTVAFAVVVGTLLMKANAQCAANWILFTDTDGLEGADSCIQAFAGPLAFLGALNDCQGRSAHLLTIKSAQSQGSNLLYAAAVSAIASM
jgi:hypothetical protein